MSCQCSDRPSLVPPWIPGDPDDPVAQRRAILAALKELARAIDAIGRALDGLHEVSAEQRDILKARLGSSHKEADRG